MPAAAASGGLPTRLGKYEIVSALATGGMARIYIARSTGIGSFERHVVLKLITPERANDTVAVSMFLDEARLAASLNHQNVAQVFEVGEDGGIHYLAMEYVHGQDLRALLAKAGSQGTRVPLELALTVVAGAASGLNHAHERRGPDGVPLGIVHRDVSPSNIMIGYDGAVKLLDFGIAKAAARSVETQSGIIKGKFAYMAPEQCRGRDVDRRSDVFSLGIILYEITTQHRCFRADSDFDTMHRIVTGDVVRPSRLIHGYPPALEAIVMKALAIDVNQRYQSAGLLLEALESFSVSARMSLSTMALGRFMREMFGEQQEPWLVQNGRMAGLPPQQKESTISSTDGGSRLSVNHIPAGELPADPDSVSSQGRTVLDLPRGDEDEDDHGGDREDEEPNVGEWNAKSYPAVPPVYASTSTIPPGSDVRASAASLAPRGPMSGPMGAVVPLQGAAPPGGAALGSAAFGGAGLGGAPTGPPLMPMGAVAVPAGSSAVASAFPAGAATGSGQSVAPPGSPAMSHGYPSAAGLTGTGMSRSELEYPRYDPSSEMSEELRLKPSRRPLYIGGGIILIVLAVVIAMTIGGSGGNVGSNSGASPPSAPPETELRPPAESSGGTPATGSDGSAAPEAAAPEQPTPTPGSDTPDPDTSMEDETISIRVTSDPSGADVLLSGKSIGTTPLDRRWPKGTTSAFLVVHRAKFVDVTSRIDLSGDLQKHVTLKPLEDPDEEKKKAEEERKRQGEAKAAEQKRLEEKRQAEARAVEQRRLEERRQAEARAAEQRRQAEARRLEEQRKAQEKKQQPLKCQNPAQYNPFDTSCVGMPGASATGACPACKDFK